MALSCVFRNPLPFLWSLNMGALPWNQRELDPQTPFLDHFVSRLE